MEERKDWFLKKRKNWKGIDCFVGEEMKMWFWFDEEEEEIFLRFYRKISKTNFVLIL